MDENTIETTAEVCENVANDELYTDATVIEDESSEHSSLGGTVAFIGAVVTIVVGSVAFIYNRKTGKISQLKTDCISRAADNMCTISDKRDAKQARLDAERVARATRREERRNRKLQQKRIGGSGDENATTAEENK